MTNQLNINTLISIFRKNYFIFILSFIFFSLTPIFLIYTQNQNTLNLSSVGINIHANLSTETKLNYIIERVNWYNKVLNQAYTEVSIKTNVVNNIYIDNKDPYISLAETSPINLYKNNYIEFLYNELIFSQDFNDIIINNNKSLINNYFDENDFDKDYLNNLIKNLDIDLQSNKSYYLKHKIEINSFSTNVDLFIKYISFLIDFCNEKVSQSFIDFADNIHKVYEEKYLHLLTMSSNMQSKSLAITLLIKDYNPESLKLFFNNQIPNIFKLNTLENVKKYNKSFELTQPSIIIILIFAFFASCVIVISKDKYLSS